MKYIGQMLWLLLWKIIFMVLGFGSGFMIFNSLATETSEPALKSFLWFLFCVCSFSLARNMKLSPEKEKEIEDYLKKLQDEEDEG